MTGASVPEEARQPAMEVTSLHQSYRIVEILQGVPAIQCEKHTGRP